MSHLAYDFFAVVLVSVSSSFCPPQKWHLLIVEPSWRYNPLVLIGHPLHMWRGGFINQTPTLSYILDHDWSYSLKRPQSLRPLHRDREEKMEHAHLGYVWGEEILLLPQFPQATNLKPRCSFFNLHLVLSGCSIPPVKNPKLWRLSLYKSCLYHIQLKSW